ncbi:MAG: hypothetical protein OXC95_18580 [Dehalococcoidia bacterium]|nr:hypothetical protein [Dehalococcoidia bacterium]
MRHQDQQAEWEANPEPGNPQALSTLRAARLPDGVHIEKITPQTYCIISDGPNHYVHLPADQPLRLRASDSLHEDRHLTVDTERDDPQSIDTVATRSKIPASVSITKISGSRAEMTLNGHTMRFEKTTRRGPAIIITRETPTYHRRYSRR